MIDMFSGSLPCLHSPLNTGRIISIDPDGQTEWESPKRLVVAGSHDSNFRVSSEGSDGQGRATHLRFSGNPSKFLQGHNIFGSDDLVSLMNYVYKNVTQVLNLGPTAEELFLVRTGKYSVTSFDVNYSYELGLRSDVRAWIRAAEYTSKTRHGRPSTKGGTIYWGKNSKRWALKAYSKGDEISAGKGHNLPTSLLDTPLVSWADNKLRIELRLLSKELNKLNLKTANKLNPHKIKLLFNDYIQRLQMTEQITLSDDKLRLLPQRLRSTYILWRDGYDLRSELPKTTYYRNRIGLLEYGIDIALRAEHDNTSNVVPLIRILEAKPVSVPDWAFDMGLVHASAKCA
jgi:II/X family phage/plasmid replication protein